MFSLLNMLPPLLRCLPSDPPLTPKQPAHPLQVILAEDTLAPTPGRLVAIKIMRRQHAAAGQRVSAGCPSAYTTIQRPCTCGRHIGCKMLPAKRDLSLPTSTLAQEARALRYLHGSAPGGAAPGVVRLLDSFSLGAHYCLVTGECRAVGSVELGWVPCRWLG